MSADAGTYARIRDLPLTIEAVRIDRHAREVSSGFERVTTVVTLSGAGHSGLGEDVAYEAEEHDRLHAAGLPDLTGATTIGGFAARLDGLDLFPTPPEREVSRNFRRWALESAALDLALRQAGLPLHEVLGRTPRPVRFVVSTRLGEPATTAPVERWLAIDPTLRFKLDATPDWDDDLIRRLDATGAVDSVDLKGMYEDTVVDRGADPALYRRVAEGLPAAWIEDPRLTPETRAALAGHEDRITWDAPIHSVADVEALPFPPRTVNVKPSRFGSLQALMAGYDHLEARGIGAYGGGQFELGPGRGQIQYLASLFHPDGPNDTAPGGYNLPDPAPGNPPSPLDPAPSPTGFRWGEGA
ncbi:MAG: hypothetical protein MUE51_04105 [Thermoleophilia bacterium]|jgi:L-alanine-DL-glutamate epimerase-like enolase superfamily enzyme|nr:hypothetical protein [Thermoleophilia bacterium]